MRTTPLVWSTALVLGLAGCPQSAPPDSDAGPNVDPVVACREPRPEPAPTPAQGPCGSDDLAIPADAFPVTLADRENLQALLDAHNSLVFAPGDYSMGGTAALTLRSNQGLYGLAMNIRETQLPHVVIPAGTEGAIVRGITAADGIEFGAGTAVTRNNCLERVPTPIRMHGATVEDNVLLDIASLDVDTSGGGHLRNNRFLRQLTQNASWRAISLVGDAAQSSYGNVFLWTNVLTPGDYFRPETDLEAVVIENQRDVTFVGLDAEDWAAAPGASAIIVARDVGTVRLSSIGGRVMGQAAYDLDATNVLLDRTDMGALEPWLRLGGNVQSVLGNLVTTANWNMRQDEAPSDAFRVFANANGANVRTVEIDGTAATEPLTGAAETSLRALVQPARESTPWAVPTLTEPHSPACDSWRTVRESEPDDGPMIQAMIDRDGIAQLDARVYYISAPLRLQGGQSIVGRGMGRTAIIAKDPSIALVTLDPSTDGFLRIGLVDLTLQGGRVGLLLDAPDHGVNQMGISHVAFRDMSQAGIHAEGIGAVDNNYFSHVGFYDCAAGISARGVHVDGLWSYFDKNFWFRSQFVRCGRGVDIQNTRPNYLNVYFEASFRDSTVQAFRSEPDQYTVIASSRFENNAGSPVIANTPYFAPFVVNSHFRADTGGGSMLGHAVAEGCTFSRGSSSTAVVFDPSFEMYPHQANTRGLSNSDAREMPLGDLGRTNGVIANNLLAPGDSAFQVVYGLHTYDTRETPSPDDDVGPGFVTVLTGTSTPGSQLLCTK